MMDRVSREETCSVLGHAEIRTKTVPPLIPTGLRVSHWTKSGARPDMYTNKWVMPKCLSCANITSVIKTLV